MISQQKQAAQAYGSKFLVRSSGAEALLLPPLRLAAAVAAVDAGLWVRNGGCIQEQALNYSSISPPLCRHFAASRTGHGNGTMLCRMGYRHKALVVSSLFSSYNQRKTHIYHTQHIHAMPPYCCMCRLNEIVLRA